ncbi:MAG: sterol desaturase family protein [Chitinophagaceae bacterium]|jgi:sterol desaturase/sphingolipid hydroxylase (fatty acid hydroxylase superfamily)|nr:sterol desaturase family protein [Chitinophagaceae bacterium]OQY93640.1 MAG: fatty acid hydroxylase [Sphingobacteriales bacterium UTBCD1]
MGFEKIYNKGQARLFKSSALEFLTKAHPLVIWGMYVPVIVWMIWYSNTRMDQSALKILILFIAGMFFWSLFEYFAHRFIFHFETKNKTGQRLVYIFHGCHHEYPRDTTRLFMPPIPSILISGTVFGLMYFAMRYNAFMFFPGFMLGYLLYGTIHYAIHAGNPPFKWMKPHWRNHHLHHYKNEHLGFGVSSTLWDHVFGTMFDLKKEKEDKEKEKELMYGK